MDVLEGNMEPGSLLDIVKRLYSERPKQPLFHYTSLGGAVGIVRTGAFYATHVRYMSDASELAHTAMVLGMAADLRAKSSKADPAILRQFKEWVQGTLEGTRMFVTCFSEEGDLLSQWRGYCPDAKGVCLGFRAADLENSCKEQGFSIVRCVYDEPEQWRLAQAVVAEVEAEAERIGPSSDPRHHLCSYYGAFTALAENLLMLAVAFKRRVFSEEREWRLVSSGPRDYADYKKSIQFREGRSTLVPYIEFRVPASDRGDLLFHSGRVGPTPHKGLAADGLVSLMGSRANGGFNVTSSEIPYRAW